jgi:hypothetical protein
VSGIVRRAPTARDGEALSADRLSSVGGGGADCVRSAASSAMGLSIHQRSPHRETSFRISPATDIAPAARDTHAELWD